MPDTIAMKSKLRTALNAAARALDSIKQIEADYDHDEAFVAQNALETALTFVKQARSLAGEK